MIRIACRNAGKEVLEFPIRLGIKRAEYLAGHELPSDRTHNVTGRKQVFCLPPPVSHTVEVISV